MDRTEWRPYLRRWSEEWIAAHDPDEDGPLDEKVERERWLGFAPATEDEVAAAETRLGFRLPPSLREFLLVSNAGGARAASSTSSPAPPSWTGSGTPTTRM